MTELDNVTETNSDDIVESPQPKPRSLISRIGCWFLVAIWFLILLTPYALFVLATQGEIRISHGDIPDREAHPRLLIDLISEVDFRGLRLVNSTISNLSDTSTCIQTNVRYVLWHGDATGQDAVFCDCYVREQTESTWALTETLIGECTVPR